MTADDLVHALGLPDSTRLNQRVPKKLLAEHGAATAADRRQIQDSVEEIVWLAALKPHCIGVPAFADGRRQYVELAVLHLTLRAGAKVGRLVELLHRAVPYPVLLLTTSEAGVGVSLAHLRAAQNEADRTVLEGERLSVLLPQEAVGGMAGGAALPAFRAAMALARQPQTDLHALYQGWMDTVAALDIAGETGCFQPSRTREEAVRRHQSLQQCRALRARLKQLQDLARKERQVARQVAVNREMRDLQAMLQQHKTALLAGLTGEQT